jgi:siroheme synthase (precorrin-2 oxidase/ferrochelatase)
MVFIWNFGIASSIYVCVYSLLFIYNIFKVIAKNKQRPSEQTKEKKTKRVKQQQKNWRLQFLSKEYLTMAAHLVGIATISENERKRIYRTVQSKQNKTKKKYIYI